MNQLKPINGILVFYIDVGQMPPYKAEAFLSRMMENILEQDDLGNRLKAQNCQTLFIPVRGPEYCRTELIKF